MFSSHASDSESLTSEEDETDYEDDFFASTQKSEADRIAAEKTEAERMRAEKEEREPPKVAMGVRFADTMTTSLSLGVEPNAREFLMSCLDTGKIFLEFCGTVDNEIQWSDQLDMFLHGVTCA